MLLNEMMRKQGSFLFRWRSFLPMVILVGGFYLYSKTDFLNLPFLLSDGCEVAYFLISVLGVLIRCMTIGYAGKKTSGRNARKQVAESLNQFDLYSITRNPLYLGNFFMALGCVLMVGNIMATLLFVVVFWFYYERIIFTEEQFLSEKFGESYRQWAQKTPIFFPTSLKNYKTSGKKFDYKRVLIQEKNGVLCLFAIFFSFELWESVDIAITTHNFQADWDDYFLLVGFILSIIGYFYFRMKKRQ
jgi:protein-S-isoprenylcysteine O-methyltransferase Ste14